MNLLFTRALLVCMLSCSWVAVSHSQQVAKGVGDLPPLPPVSLDLVGASLEEVTAALYKATGVPFSAGAASLPAAFTLSVKERSVWEVFQELSRQNTLMMRPSRNGVELIAVGGPRSAMAASGPFLLLAEVSKTADLVATVGRGTGRGPYIPGGSSLIPRAPYTGIGAELLPPAEAPYEVSLAAIGDPRLIATGAALDQVEVLDETGKPMKILQTRVARFTPGATTGPWQPRPNDYERINFWAWRIAVAPAEGGGTAIGSIKGTVNLRASVKDVSVRLDDVEHKHQGEATELGSARFTLTRVVLGPRNLSFQYKAEVGASVAGAAAAPGPAARENLTPLRVELQNAAGQPIVAAFETRTMANENQSVDNNPRRPPQFPFTSPYSVVLRTSEQMEAVQVPFEIKVIEIAGEKK